MTTEEVRGIVAALNARYQLEPVVMYDSVYEACDKRGIRTADGNPAEGWLEHSRKVGGGEEVVAVLLVDGTAGTWPVRVTDAATPLEVSAALAETMAI